MFFIPRYFVSSKHKSGSSSFGRASAFQAEGGGFEPRLPLQLTIRCETLLFFCRCSSGVEYFLGKEGVTGSNPVIGSNFEQNQQTSNKINQNTETKPWLKKNSTDPNRT